MAKPIVESIKTTHKQTVSGMLDLNNSQIEIEGFDNPVKFQDLWKSFDGEYIKVTISVESEGVVDEIVVSDPDEE